ncbi:TPA: cellobiose phosphorylase [Streptococcus suis]|nr:cellobiose phosphorylase [Streptococcus suis]
MNKVEFIDKNGSFTLKQAQKNHTLYFPLASEKGLKSSITPLLGGDSKISQNSFILEPISIENLHNNRSTRNVWTCIDGKETISLTGQSSDYDSDIAKEKQHDQVTAGFMWHQLERTDEIANISTSITNFIPVSANIEVMHIRLKNLSNHPRRFSTYVAVPIFGRSADNLRDHRHVTSLLHRIHTTKNGVVVNPTMTFDERGHHPNHLHYYVAGYTGEGHTPVAFYPTVEEFIGESGNFTHPEAVFQHYPGYSDYKIDGREAMGAFRFEEVTLQSGQETSYIVLLGITEEDTNIEEALAGYSTDTQIQQHLEQTKQYWNNKVNVRFETGQADFDQWMKWICFQPYLRKIFGCSFLPHHDYGRGGRGWRDLWQDCLSLLLLEPTQVRRMIVNNFKGVRIDGTNATIIGSGEGEFIADRNGITRVWMDHAFWPLLTTKLYIDQTGDTSILTEKVSYFKDRQVKRGTAIDKEWREENGSQLLTIDGNIYLGSILEHLLIEQLATFYDVGEHNFYRLRDADWNDALDMASERGESVAFTCAYVGSMMDLAHLIRVYASQLEDPTIQLPEEFETLLSQDLEVYDDYSKKQAVLQKFSEACNHKLSGKTIRVTFAELAVNLIEKANWLREQIQKTEWLSEDENGWFNSYYDNNGHQVETCHTNHPKMMLTGQVFSIMSYVANDQQIQSIIRSADRHLYTPECGGYRLNTNFNEIKMDMGRMFGFAYGEKENGAVFSHMTTMYANALYRRGYAKAGWKALKSLSNTALDYGTSRIYPGIPEYFRADGKGLYHYLTGAASWYLYTMLTEVFGFQGNLGNLILYPKLVAEQFNQQNLAQVTTTFAGKTFILTYHNPLRKEYGDYVISQAYINGIDLPISDDAYATLSKEKIEKLDSNGIHQINITLS